MELAVIYITLMLLSVFCLGAGYYFHETTQRKQELTLSDIERLIQKVRDRERERLEPKAPSHLPDEEAGIISDEGVGIVYRPSKQELDKINEPQRIKEAKEAMIETLKQEVPPEL